MRAPLSKLARHNLSKGGTWGKVLLTVLAVVIGMLIIVAIMRALKISTMAVGYVFFIPWMILVSYFMLIRPSQLVHKKNEYDYNAAQDLYKTMQQMSTCFPIVDDTTNGMRVFRKYSLGEVTRHFDSQTNAQITGWLDHSFGVAGWGVGLQIGSVGVGTGKIGIAGQSDVHLNLSGTTRDNLMGDGFIAVLEEHPLSAEGDIIRVVVPSLPASRELVKSMLLTLGTTFGEGSHREEVCQKSIAGLQGSIYDDVMHVSDRLGKIIRLDLNRRPTITVVGIELAEHVILAGAIKFDNDNRWYQIFPLGLIQKITEVAARPEIMNIEPLRREPGTIACSSCGRKQIPGNARFCPDCGNRV